MVRLSGDDCFALAESVGKYELGDGEPTPYPAFGAREADIFAAD